MRDPAPKTIHLKDYTPPPFLIDAVDLDVDIRDDATRVRSRLLIRRNPQSAQPNEPLRLDGEALELDAVSLNGRVLAAGQFTAAPELLMVPGVPDQFTLETTSRIHPEQNTALEGLYASKTGYFTQCEAEGFRRITWFIDRPDVMSKYTVTIHAARERFPVLLSNGNLVGQGRENGGRHWAKFVDPFPKPAYLFALVAAKLDLMEDKFVTRSGRTTTLGLYVEPGKLDSVAFAMQALKRAIKWDEDTFGLELDLDHYKIVAVGDFNSGAMENKGLNIFNTKYLLATPEIATDVDYMNVDRVIAHEYFHNWTGDRVTCRDWFQLSLKEGLTVFRDQEYGADVYSRPVQRIQEVRGLRAAQFPEDAGPMAHPVRPQSYMEIRNFYTMTVYEKGAEVVRMIQTLTGRAGFRKGMDLYFQRHDGQAVTCDDFVQAMADANGLDLTQFKRWYDQAGTPVVEVEDAYDPAQQTYTLTVRQSCPPTPGQDTKLPFHIPFAVGLVGPDGASLPLRLAGEAAPQTEATRVLSLTEPEHRFTFTGVAARPVPSLARGFSAPVNVRYPYADADLAHLLAHDADSFNRWEAGQRLALNIILRGIEARRDSKPVDVPEGYVEAVGRILLDAPRDPAFAAEALRLPAETYIAEQMEVVDPDAIHEVRNAVALHLANALATEFRAAYAANTTPGAYAPEPAAIGKRALKNVALGYLMERNDAAARALCKQQFDAADNMTDRMAALALLANSEGGEREDALAAFYERAQDDPLLTDKWLAVQATSRLPSTLSEVRRLTRHPAFDVRNPNKVYSLIRAFCGSNHVRFHAADGGGYAFAADQVLAIEKLNPQVAARIARCFDRWRKFDAGRQAHARAALERIRNTKDLSKDVAEIVTKALG
jgi:aminopeptidase N